MKRVVLLSGCVYENYLLQEISILQLPGPGRVAEASATEVKVGFGVSGGQNGTERAEKQSNHDDCSH